MSRCFETCVTLEWSWAINFSTCESLIKNHTHHENIRKINSPTLCDCFKRAFISSSSSSSDSSLSRLSGMFTYADNSKGSFTFAISLLDSFAEFRLVMEYRILRLSFVRLTLYSNNNNTKPDSHTQHHVTATNRLRFRSKILNAFVVDPFTSFFSPHFSIPPE